MSGEPLFVLIDATAKSTAVILAALVAVACMRGASAATRHLLLGAALAIAVLLPIASVVLPAYRLPILPSAQAASPSAPARNIPPPSTHWPAQPPAAYDDAVAGPGDPLFVPSPMPQLLPLAAPPVQRDVLRAPRAAVAQEPAAARWRGYLPLGILLVWLAGSSIATAVWSIGILAAVGLSRRGIAVVDRKILQALASTRQSMGVRRGVECRMLEDLASPLVCCWGARSRILLPAAASAWSADQLRSVLLHELAHVKRRDCHTQILAQAACVIYWFNPLFWLAVYRLRIERERACDDLVLSHGIAAESYAEHLLEIARSLRKRSLARFGAVAMAQRSGLRQRIGELLNQGINRRAVSARLTITSLITAAVVLLALSALRLERRSAAMGQSVSPAPAANAATTQPTSTDSVAKPVAPATPSQHLLKLTVTDRSTHRPLAGVDIGVERIQEAFKSRTAPDGTATVPVGRQGYFAVRLSFKGYVQMTLLWKNQRGAFVNDSVPGSLAVEMDPGRTIGGRVVDDTGKAVRGAHVEISIEKELADPHQHLSHMTFVRSKADGTWSYDNAPIEPDSVEVGVWDYDYATDGEYTVEPQLIDKLLARDVTLVLSRGVAVTGTVIGPDGQPVSGARVQAGGQPVGNRLPAQSTDVQGRFTYVGKPNATLVLTTSVAGFAPSLREIHLGDQPLDVKLTLATSKPLTGLIVDQAGKPVPFALVFPDTWHGYPSLQARIQADKNGKFIWNNPPSDTVYYDVDATEQGFMRLQSVPMTAGDQPVVIKVMPALHVTGSVADAQTGKPIDVFTVVRGIARGYGEAVFWDRTRATTSRHGVIDYHEDWEQPGYATRIEAAGYLPAESRVFHAEEGKVKLDFRLQPAADWKARLLFPDGKPAAGAVAILVLPGQNPFQFDGNLTPRYEDPFHLRFTAGGDGTLDIPPQPGTAKLAVIDKDAYAIVDQQILKKGGDIHLQPWARVTGHLMVGKNVGANMKVAIFQREPGAPDASQPMVMAQMQAPTDKDGAFHFDCVPAGTMGVARYVEQGDGVHFWGSYASVKTVELSAGQTLELTLGGSGRAVIGRLNMPAELASRSDWAWSIDCRAMTLTHDMPKLDIPDDVKAGTPEQRKAWYDNFVKSDAGKAYSAAVEKAQQSVLSLPLELQRDGSFRIEDVPAGSYTLSAGIALRAETANSCIGEAVAQGGTTFTVPPMPGGRDDVPLELPPIQLEMLKTVKVGENAPDFSVKTLDNHDLKLADLRGKYVLLEFWATWCGPCVAETPSMKAAFDAAGKSANFAMISLSLDQKPEDASRYVDQNKLAWNQGFLPGGWNNDVVKSYGVQSIPSIWLIGPDGKVVAKDLRGTAIKETLEMFVK